MAWSEHAKQEKKTKQDKSRKARRGWTKKKCRPINDLPQGVSNTCALSKALSLGSACTIRTLRGRR